MEYVYKWRAINHVRVDSHIMKGNQSTSTELSLLFNAAKSELRRLTRRESTSLPDRSINLPPAIECGHHVFINCELYREKEFYRWFKKLW